MNGIIKLILFLAISLPQMAFAQDLSGYDIMQRSFNRDDGRDGYFKTEMILLDRAGSQRKRLLEVYTKDYGKLVEGSGSFPTPHPEERSDEGSPEILQPFRLQDEPSEKNRKKNSPSAQLVKNFIKFIEPKDIKGTGFLSWENETGDDTQYLYLPELGRARRIVSSQKNLRFVNTDFSYEDMQRRRPQKDEHKYLDEKNFNGRDCFVIENLPKDKSQYSKRVSWVDKESLVIVKIDFYNKKGNKVKIFNVEKLEKKSGIWTAMDTVMEDLKDRHKTTLKILEVNYNQGLDDNIFTIHNLEQE